MRSGMSFVIGWMSMAAVVVSAWAGSSAQAESSVPSLIPLPAEVSAKDGAYTLGTTIAADDASKDQAKQLVERLQPATGMKFEIVPFDGKTTASIVLTQSNDLSGKEAYRLRVTPQQVTLVGGSSAGVFYGIQTFLQLLPTKIYAKTVQSGVTWDVPCVEIVDQPRFGWRGFMLDESRHFLGEEYVKRLIDLMAMHKLNVFHWHLSDDDGFRIEIKSYPKLTEVGAWRGTECASPNTRPGETFKRYGGFYTQEQIKNIVAYAAQRHINIVPEIDVPGHSMAIAVAYPEILCEGDKKAKSVQGVSGNVWCAGREENFKMIDAIVGELAQLFPFGYIHIGGDEVNHAAWKNCPHCQALMKDKKMTHLGQIQDYFITRSEEIVRKHGRKMIGWNEIFNEGLAKDTTIMSWTGVDPGYHAAAKGWTAIMAPGPHAYFDMKESPRDTFGHSWAGIVSLDRVYAFDPLSKQGLDGEQKNRIMGVQACLWTEYITSLDRGDLKIWPRLSALAEVGWTPQANRDFEKFMNRLGPTHLERLAYCGVNYRVPDAETIVKDGKLTVRPPYAGADVRYTTDGSDPTPSSPLASKEPMKVENPGKVAVRVFGPGEKMSNVVKGAKFEIDRSNTLKPKATVATTMPTYTDNKPENAVDWKPRSFFWSSRNGQKGDTFVMTFEQPTPLSFIEIYTGKLDNPAQDCVKEGTLYVSNDGKEFRRIVDFVNGRAGAEMPNDTIKAIKIELNANHDTWIVIQDPVLRK